MPADVRIGLIGTGAIAQVAHLPILRKLKGVQIAALCDSDGAKTRALAERMGVDAWYTDIEEMLEFAKPDAVVVCTPNHLHEIHTLSALAAGAHVIVERPLALQAAGVSRVLKASQKAGRNVLVAMNHRFRSDAQAVHQFLRGGELGDILTIRCGWHVFRAAKHQLGWRSRKSESGGGVIMDLGLPMLDLAIWLAGRPEIERVSASLRLAGGGQVDELAGVQLYCAGGINIYCDVSWRYVGNGERFWLDVQAGKGSASIAPLRVFKELHGQPADVTPTGAASRENLFTQSYRSEWAYFLAGVRGEVELAPPEDQVRLHQVVAAIYQSAEERRDVKL